MDKKIGILGSGIVGRTLAHGFEQHGHAVMLGSRSGRAIDDWDGEIGTFDEVARASDVIVLAVKGAAAEEVVRSVAEQLKGKVVIDTTNPIADSAPDEGVLSYFTTLDRSLMELLQDACPDARFVKAFSCVGNAYMVNPTFDEGTPTMFICGNDEESKAEVSDLLREFGWDVSDMGTVKAARAIEPLCMLWCLPGIRNNEWSHAFKLLKTTT